MKYKRILNFFRSKERIAGLCIFLVFLAIYTTTAARAILPIANAGELTIAGINFGLLHSPGYVLYTVLLSLWIHILPFGAPAFRAGLLSALMQAIQVTISFGIISLLLQNVRLRGIEERIKKKKYKTIFYASFERHLPLARFTISILFTLFIGFGQLFWFYSGIPDQYIFANTLFVLLFFLSLTLTKYLFKANYKPIELRTEEGDYHTFVNERYVNRLLVWILILSGLLLLLVFDMLLVVPIILLYTIFLLIRTRYIRKILTKKHIFWGGVIFLLSLVIPIVLAWIMNLHNHDLSWSFDMNIQGLWGYLTGYTGNESVSIFNFTWGNIQTSLNLLWQELVHSYGPLVLIPALCGVIFLLLRNRLLFMYLFFLTLFATCLLFFYKAPSSSLDKFSYMDSLGLLQRHYMLVELLVVFVAAIGLYGLYKFFIFVFSGDSVAMIRGKAEVVSVPVFMKIGFLVILLLVFGIVLERQFSASMSVSSHQDGDVIESYAKHTLASTDKNAIVLCFSDISCYSYIYVQEVEGVRRDITIVPGQYTLRKSYLDMKPGLQRFFYPTTPYSIGDIVSWNIYNGRSVYIADNPKDYISYIGLDGQTFFMAPGEYSQKIVKKLPDHYGSFAYNDANNYMNYVNGLGDETPWRDVLSGFFTGNIITNAYLFWETGDVDLSYKDAQLAADLSHGYEPYQKLAKALSSDTSQTPYTHGQEIYSADYLYNLGLQSQDKPQNAYLFALRATFIDPLNIPARILLAQLYANAGYIDQAKTEYRNILKLDPNNADALKGLKSIS